MLFNTIEFALFFALVFALYSLLARSRRWQNALLLIASYVFYGAWDWRFLSLIAISTVVDYACARGLATATGASRRKALLTISMVTNLGILGYFKYAGFFAESLTELFAVIGFDASYATLKIVLPVGISFYTFQTMSYTIDVYRGKLKPCRNFLDFALFVAFFPQLVAGPIERATALLPRIQKPRNQTLDGLYEGAYLILWGLYKKVVIADNLAPTVDTLFANPNLGSADVIIGSLFFAVQIYCDFSGYSNIARGIAKTLGFELMLNFNLPYFATNPQDFWRRWHISLSTWLRDYLYFSLGGNRKGTSRTYLNLMLTMVLGGLWHGAAWTFVVWGIFHGGLLAIHRYLLTTRPQVLARIPIWLAWAAMSALTLYGWLIFRATDFSQLATFSLALVTEFPDPRSLLVGTAKLGYYSWLLAVVQLIQHRTKNPMAIIELPWPIQALFFYLCFYSIVILGKFDAASFIYFQF